MSEAQNPGQDDSAAGRPMIGIYGFSYGPYALGDALTWAMNLNVIAAAVGCGAIDQYLVIDPIRRTARPRQAGRHRRVDAPERAAITAGPLGSRIRIFAWQYVCSTWIT